MTSKEPSNIPNKYSTQLLGRLVPKQKIHSRPVTFASTLSKNHALAQKTIIQPKPKKVQILQQVHEEPKEIQVEQKALPLTKDPLEYIRRAKAGLDTREYVYLEPSDIIEDSEHPTCLRIIPSKNMNEAHFWTLSLKGLTHFNRPDVDFIPLDQWLRECDLFSRILAIPFFKYQRQWRHFKTWRRNLQNQKLTKAQTGLTANLFFANPILRPAFIKIQRELNNLQNVKLYVLNPAKIYTLESFAEENEKYKEKIKQKFEEFFNVMVTVVASACEKCMDTSRAHDKEKEEEGNLSPLDALLAQYERQQKQTEGRSSTYEAPSNLKYTNKATYNALCQMVVRFVRMIDYVVVNALKEICDLSMLEMYSMFWTLQTTGAAKLEYDMSDCENLTLPNQWQNIFTTLLDNSAQQFTKPIFAIDAAFDKGLKWLPMFDDFYERIETIRKVSIRSLFSIPRLISHPVFKPYIAKVIASGPTDKKKLSTPDITHIIQSDHIYKLVIDKQKDLIHTAFNFLDFYAQGFQSSVEMYEKNSHFDVKFLENESVTIEQIKNAINELTDQEAKIKDITDFADVGVFQCCTKPMKKLFMKSPTTCLKEIRATISKISSKFLATFGEKVRNSYNELSIQIENVEQFVDYLNAVQKNEEMIRDMYHMADLIKDLHSLAEEIRIQIPNTELNEYSELIPLFDAVKRYLSYAEDNRQQLLPKFSLMLEKSVAALHSRVIEVVLLANNAKLSSLDTTNEEAQTILREVCAKADVMNSTAKQYNQFQDVMVLTKTDFDDVQQLVNNVELKKLLWDTKEEWAKKTEEWCETPFESINPEVMVQEINSFVEKANRVAAGLQGNAVAQDLKEKVDDFEHMVPIISDLKNPALKQTHTEQIEELLGDHFFTDPLFKFGKLVELKAYKHVDKITQISEQATNEQALLDQLNSVKNSIESLQFNPVPIKNYKNMYYLEGTEQISSSIDDAISTLSLIRASKFVAQHRARAEEWVKSMHNFQQSIETIAKCQTQLIYFLEIFSNSDLSRQLSTDQKELSSIEKTWKSFSNRANDDPYAYKLCNTGNIMADLQIANQTMDNIRRDVEQFLETKRMVFPRLYLLSNNEFLNLLSKPKEIHAIIPYLSKIFTGISTVEFTMESNIPSIAYCISELGERLQIRPVKFHTNIESWLQGLCESMQKTVKNDIKAAEQKYGEMVREDWAQVTNTQYVLVVSHIARCKQIETALRAPDPAQALSDLEQELEQSMTNLVRFTHLELHPVEKNKFESLMLLDMLYRQITEELMLQNARSVQDPSWNQQLLYKWDESSKELMVTQNYESFEYGYEYIGRSTRFVQTRSVSDTYTSILTPFKACYGVAVIGNSMFGKTESIMNLAEALGYFVAIRTCTNAITSSQISSVLRGAAQGGFWVAFEHFTSLEKDVLSAVAEQFQAIQYAKVAQLKKFELDGYDIPLNINCSVFVTIPNTELYYEKLPENLKESLRPVNLYPVDLTNIIESLLFTFGFNDCPEDADKIASLFTIGKAMVSEQARHLLSLKSLIDTLYEAKKLKFSLENPVESEVIAQAIAEQILPQLNIVDQKLLLQVIGDEFGYTPEIYLQEDQIIKVLPEAASKASLTPNDYLFRKVIQLHSLSQNHQGIIITGAPCCGKSSIIRILEEARAIMHPMIESYSFIDRIVLSPGMHTLTEFFGYLDPQTGKLSEGVFGTLVGNVQDYPDHEPWVIFDSDLDPSWTDVLIPVFDIQHTISLSTGSTYKVPLGMKFIFETNDMSKATPAILARCAIITMSPKRLGTEPFVKTAMEQRILPLFQGKDKIINKLNELVKETIVQGIDFIKELTGLYTPYNTIDTFFSFFASLLKNNEFSNHKDAINIVASIFTFAYIWSYAGFMNNQQRVQFETFARDVLGPLCSALPPRGILFDYTIDTTTGKWSLWQDHVKPFGLNENSEYTVQPSDFKKNVFFVETAETTRMTAIMKMLLNAHRHIIFTGASASGRTSLIKKIVNDLVETEGFTSHLIQFSDLMTGETFQQRLMLYLERVGGKVLQPEGKSQGIITIDRMNETQTKEPLEIIRSIFTGVGIRAAPSYQLLQTKNFSLICISSLDPISNRLSSHAYTLQYTAPDSNTIANIIGSMYHIFFGKTFDDKIVQNSNKYGQTLAMFYEKISANMNVTDITPQLKFSLHDLFRVVRSMFYVTPMIAMIPEELETILFSEVARAFRDRITLPGNIKTYTDSLSSAMKTKLAKDSNPESFTDKLFADLTISFPEHVDQRFSEYNEEKIKDQLEIILLSITKSKKSQTEMILPLVSSGLHLTRLVKILKRPRGNAVLFGNIGTGKTTVARLALHTVGSDIVEASSIDDIRTAIIKTGLNGKKITLLVRGNALQNNHAFKTQLGLLMTTENPLQFLTQEDIDKGCNEIVLYAKQIGQNESIHTLRHLFLERIQQYLHVLFLIDAPNLQIFNDAPNILSQCTFDHFDSLPDDALKAIADATFAELPEREKITDAAVFVHNTASETAQKMLEREKITYTITPSVFISFLSTFIHIVKVRIEKNKQLKQKFSEGIEKIKYVSDFLQTTEKLLLDLQPKFEQRTLEADNLLHYINENEVTYEKISQRLLYEENQMKKKTDEIDLMVNEMKSELDGVTPQLETAIAQLKGLNRGDIMDLKSIGDPPVVVKTVMEVICILAEVDTTWKAAIQLLSDPTFISRISSKYNEENHVPDDILQRIKPYVESNPNFQESEVGRVSVAAKSLCMWATSLYNYEITYESIQPKVQQIESRKKSIKKDKKLLDKRRADVQKLKDTIQELKDKCDEANKEKRKLSETITNSKNRVTQAKRLLQILHEEEVTWKSNYESEVKQTDSILYDAFVCAAFLVYFGPMPSFYRDSTYTTILNYLSEQKMPISQRFSFIRSMVDSQTTRSWIENGLPDDRSCLESAAIIMFSEKAPFILDKTGIAAHFIRNMESSKQIAVVRPTSPNLMRTIESSIRLGVPILIEDNNEGFDPALENLALRKTFKQDGKNYVKLGDKFAECDENYKLYMTVPLAETPSPQAFTKSTVVNFDITKEAFAKQEVHHIVSLVNPTLSKDIETTREQIICEEKAIKQVQDKLLELLRTTPDEQLLDDDILITTIEGMKQSLSDSTRQLRVCQQKIDKCMQERDSYMPVSKRIALISEAASKFSKNNISYCFSHSFIEHVVDMTLSGDKSTPEEMIPKITYALFAAISRAMVYTDQLNFALTVATDLAISERRLSNEELAVLLRPPKPVKTPRPSPVPEMSTESWQKINALCYALPALKPIPDLIVSSKDQISSWYKTHTTALPSTLTENLTEFQCLLLQREMNPSHFEEVLRIYIEHSLGKEYSQPITFDLSKSLSIAGANTPILVTIHGPVTVRSYVNSIAKGRKLHVRSLGRGQNQIVEKTLTTAMQKGELVLLENCEALPSFITEIDNMISKGGANPNFLLILSTKDASMFPPRLLNLAAKCALETPHSTKAHIIEALNSLPKDFFAGQHACRLSLSLALSHAIFIGRSQFEHFDFAAHCVFNLNDFKYASQVIKPYISIAQTFSYQSTRVQLCMAYAGHSRFPTDRDVIYALFDRLMNGLALSPTSPILGVNEIVSVPEDRNELMDFVKSTSDAEAPSLFSLPPHAYVRTKDIKATTVPIPERQMFLDNILKGLPEIDPIVPSVIEPTTEIDCSDVIFERNALRELKAISYIKSISPLSESKIWSHEVPDALLKELPWPGPLESWLGRLFTAADTFNMWWRKARPPVIDLSSFADPKAFLSSIVAKHAHINQIQLTGTILALQGAQNIDQPAEYGVYISGLSIVGGAWDSENELVVDAEENILNKLPVLHLVPTSEVPSDYFFCPLYSVCNGTRTLVTKIPIPVARSSSFWQQRGLHLIFTQ